MLLTIKQGDTSPVSGTVRAPSGAPVNLTGATLRWVMTPAVGTPSEVIDTPADILDAPAGRFRWRPDTLAVDTPGVYRAVVRIAFADGSQGTFPASGYIDVQIQPTSGYTPAPLGAGDKGPPGDKGPAGDRGSSGWARLSIGGAPLVGRTAMPNSGSYGAVDEKYNSVLTYLARFSSMGMRLVFPNWEVTSEDVENTNAITIRAAVEYPIGVALTKRSLVYFNGARDGVISGGGQGISDLLAPAVPFGSLFRVWTFASPAVGGRIPLIGFAPNLGSDGHARGTAQTDQTTTANTLPASTESTYGPSVILGFPSVTRVIGAVGDSITQGIGDSKDDVAGANWGWFERAFANFSRVNAARAGEYAQAIESVRMRRRLLDGCTDIFEAWGSNNIALGANFGGQDSAGLKGTKLAAWRYLSASGARVWAPTIVPRTNGTGANATNALLSRKDLMDWMKDGAPMNPDGSFAPTGATGGSIARAAVYGPTGVQTRAASGPWHPTNGGGICHIAILVETAEDSNLWKLGFDAADQTHPSATGHAALAGGLPMTQFA